MELSFKELSSCTFSKKVTTPCRVEADIIVPDIKPDIHKILSVSAVCHITNEYIKSGKLTISGDVKFNILYTSETEKDRIYTIDYLAPFNHQCETAAPNDECMCSVKSFVTSADFKLKNSRKLSAIGDISIDALISSYDKINVIDSISGDDAVPYKLKNIASDSMIVQKKLDISLSDSLSLPASGDDVNIYDVDLRLDTVDIKTVNNKAIIKGTIAAKVFYSSTGEPSTYETDISFTEIADLDMANSDSRLSSHFEISNISYGLEDSVGEKNINLDMEIKGYIRAFNSEDYTLVENIYSPDYKYTKKESMETQEKLNIFSENKITVKDSIAITDKEGISKVYYMNVYPSYNKISADSASVSFSGNIETTLIYSDTAGELCSAKKTTKYNMEIPSAHNLDDAIFDIDLSASNFGYMLGANNEIQLRIVLASKLSAICQIPVSAISEFSEDKSSPIDKSAQPSIMVCYPQKPSSLWDYAVKYNTTCEEIAAVNNVEPSYVPPVGKALIIPKRHNLQQ